jgi:predicted nuclease of predicted toxin-antitoxin system
MLLYVFWVSLYCGLMILSADASLRRQTAMQSKPPECGTIRASNRSADFH